MVIETLAGLQRKLACVDKFHRNAIAGTTGIVTCQQTWRSSRKRTVTPFNVDTPENRIVAVLAVCDTVEVIVFPVFFDCLLVSVVTIAESSTTHCCAEPALFNPHLHAICVWRVKVILPHKPRHNRSLPFSF